MPVKIHGKDYKTVAERVAEFRQVNKKHSIKTNLVSNQDGVIVMRADISDPEGRHLGTGYAEEVRGSTNINKTSALENCETSAIGRALAACGFGGEQYASANEVTYAVINQAVMESTDKLIRHNQAVKDNFTSIMAIKKGMAVNDLDSAFEAFSELSEQTLMDLRLAATKGGIFTTEENNIFKSNEWSAARAKFYGE